MVDDGGNMPTLFSLNNKGKINKEIYISVKNLDWELSFVINNLLLSLKVKPYKALLSILNINLKKKVVACWIISADILPYGSGGNLSELKLK